MSVKSRVRVWLGFLRRVVHYRSLSTATLVQKNRLIHDLTLRPEGGRILVEELGITLDPKKHAYYVPFLRIGRDALNYGTGTFGMDENNDPEFLLENLRVTPQGLDDLLVIEEVFVRRLYEMYDDREWFVVDIGMNVGMASLYYAGIKGYEVVSYEPFPKTFEIARQNVEHNGLQSRVHMRNAGVDGKAARLRLPYNEDARATNSLTGNLAEERKTKDEVVEIEVLDAADVFEEALAMAGERPLLAKIDCEGAEYAILERLVERKLFDRIDAFVIEYHFLTEDHTADRIRKPLLDHGYLVKTVWISPGAAGIFAMRK